MPRTFERHTIAPGIKREGSRLVATVRIGGSRDGAQIVRRQAFPLGTSIPTMQAWQFDQKHELYHTRPTAAPGSLAADIPVYLATLPAGRYKADSTELLAHWAALPLAQQSRAAITRLDVLAQITAWTDAGAAASTCNRRLSRLRKLYHAFDGPTAPNPTDKITFLRQPEGDARDIPFHVVKKILDALPDRGRAERFQEAPKVSLTKLRLSVMAWTGMAPASIARIQPRDLDVDGARLFLRPRQKGQGSAGVWVALLPAALEAVRAFIAAGLCGQTWSNASMGQTWRRGIKRARKLAIAAEDETLVGELDALPPRCKPYDLRHSFGSEIYRQTGDLAATAELMQHRDLETTKRYTKGAVSSRVTAAIAKLKSVYASAVAPTPPPRTHAFRLVKPTKS